MAGAGLLLSPTAVCAQDYTAGDLTGRVETDAHAPVAGATVTVRSAQGQTRSARTERDGSYRISALAAGAYQADVAAPGLLPLNGQAI